MKWAYGVTTVDTRLQTTLPITLESLARAGFPKPRLFIDGCTNLSSVPSFNLPFTVRDTPSRIVCNWVTAAWEIYCRAPTADRYALFQDDVLAVRNLRKYLEHCPYPREGYWNLYTFKENLALTKGIEGWHLSNQRGQGALGLVFNRPTLILLLQARSLAEKPATAQGNRAWSAIDGGVLTALKQVKHQELIHNPSLLQHQDSQSTIGHTYKPLAEFPGEVWDPMKLVDRPPVVERIPTPRDPDGKKVQKSILTKALEYVEVDRGRVNAWINSDCTDCLGRVSKLRILNAWATRVVRGKTKNAQQHLLAIIEDSFDEDCS